MIACGCLIMPIMLLYVIIGAIVYLVLHKRDSFIYCEEMIVWCLFMWWIFLTVEAVIFVLKKTQKLKAKIAKKIAAMQSTQQP